MERGEEVQDPVTLCHLCHAPRHDGMSCCCATATRDLRGAVDRLVDVYWERERALEQAQKLLKHLEGLTRGRAHPANYNGPCWCEECVRRRETWQAVADDAA